MRDLRFRVWDSCSQQYHLPYDGRPAVGVTEPFYLTMGGNLVGHDGTLSYPVDQPLVVEQYTGLKDSKGVDIVEGDIMQDHYNDGTRGPIALVRWISRADKWDYCGFAAWPARLPLGDWREDNPTVVIGNVHQHPELLKGAAP